jgi:hypothetical protein
MDFGFARFLEMFEERFGSRPTTVVLAIIGLAVTAWAVGEIVDKTIYFYGLISSAHFLAALEQESATTHIIIFAVQIGVTFLVLAFIWRWFYSRKLKNIENDLETSRARIESKLEQAAKRTAEFEADIERRGKASDQQAQELLERMESLKVTHEKLLAEKAKLPKAD